MREMNNQALEEVHRQADERAWRQVYARVYWQIAGLYRNQVGIAYQSIHQTLNP